MKLLMLATVALLGANEAAAQKQCKKGKPCGNTCIAVSRTCHIGQPSQAPQPAPSAPAAPTPLSLIESPAQPRPALPLIVLAPSDTAWVGFTLSKFVFPNHPQCQAGRLMAREHRKFFPIKAAAKAEGYQDVGNLECQAAKP